MSVRALVILALLVLTGRPSTAAADPAVPVLLYHRFDPERAAAMTVTTPVLTQQLAWLGEHKITAVPLRTIVGRLRSGTPLPESSVSIAADDGHRSVYTEMFPLIERYRIPVTLFIYPSAISNAHYALTWDQLRDMLRSGLVDVQSHTYWHPNFYIERARLAPPAYLAFAMRQLTLSKSRLDERLGIHVNLLAWPFGIHDAELEHLASDAGYVAAFTIERVPVQQGMDLFALPRFIVTDEDRGDRFAAIVLSGTKGTAR